MQGTLAARAQAERPPPQDADAASRLGGRDLALTLLVAVVWGLNFVPIKWALAEAPALLVAALRFLLAAVPLAFFVPRPRIPLANLVAYGLLIGVVQFGCLFLAIRLGMAAGLASLLMQTQVFFTVALAAVFTGDPVRRNQVLGALVSFAGVGVLAWDLLADGAGSTPAGLLLIGIAALGWSGGNVLAKATARRHGLDMFALVVWSSLVAPVPLAVLSYILEGGAAPFEAALGASPRFWLSLLFMAYVATLFGYGTWNRLLHRHPASVVTPFTMAIPVAGLSGAALLLGERLGAAQLLGAAVVVAGLAVGLLGGRAKRPVPPEPASFDGAAAK